MGAIFFTYEKKAVAFVKIDIELLWLPSENFASAVSLKKDLFFFSPRLTDCQHPEKKSSRAAF